MYSATPAKDQILFSVAFVVKSSDLMSLFGSQLNLDLRSDFILRYI